MAASLLDHLDDEQRRAVLATATRRKFRRGEVVFHEGDPGDSLHLVEKGHVAIRVSTPLGDTATLTVVGPGQAFGEGALLSSDGRRTASAVALVASETRMLRGDAFAELRARNPRIEAFLTDVLADQVRRLSTHLVEALYVPVDTRVMRRLLTLSDSFASGDEPPELPITQDDLAGMAGTTRPSANRVLKGLEADGVVTVGRGRVRVLDRDELARRAR